MSRLDAGTGGGAPERGPLADVAGAALVGPPPVEAPPTGERRGRTRVRAAARSLLALAAAVLAAEALLRVVMQPEEAFGTWFPRGIHTPDAKYGFVFTPGFRGVMCHEDGVPCVPLALDRHGYRLPAGPAGGAAAADVVIVGGFSSMFSYGLADRETIHAQVALHAKVPVRVHNTAWPGFDLLRSFHVYRDLLEPEVAPRVAVLAVYDLEPYPHVGAAIDPLPEPAPREETFEFFDDLALGPQGRVARRLGRLYYATYLVPRGVALARSARTSCLELAERARRLLSRGGGRAERTDPEREALRAEHLGRRRALFSYLARHFAERGAKVLVVFLPDPDGGPDHYAAAVRCVPDGVPWIDIHRELGTGFLEGHTIAAGHYDARAASRIGARIAEGVSALLAGAHD